MGGGKNADDESEFMLPRETSYISAIWKVGAQVVFHLLVLENIRHR